MWFCCYFNINTTTATIVSISIIIIIIIINLQFPDSFPILFSPFQIFLHSLYLPGAIIFSGNEISILMTSENQARC